MTTAWNCASVSRGCNPSLAASAAAAASGPAAVAAPPARVRFAAAEYFEAGLSDWDYLGGYKDVDNSTLRLQAYYANDVAIGVAPWVMTYGHLVGRTLAETLPDRAVNAQLLFDYRDDQNYKFAGLRVGGGRWVIGVVAEGVETILADSTVAPPQANTWYKLDVVIARVAGQDKVTLYANDVARVTWPRSSGPILTGGRVGVMVRGGAAQFQELEQWDVGHPEPRSREVPRSTRSAKTEDREGLKGSGGLRAL